MSKQIAFVDSNGKLLFEVEDGSQITFHYKSGISYDVNVYYVDSTHALIDRCMFHLHDFAKAMSDREIQFTLPKIAGIN